MWPVPSSPPPPPPCRPGGVGPPASAGKPHSPRLVLPSTARSMMVGRVFLVLTGACQFGHGVGGFTTNFIHSRAPGKRQNTTSEVDPDTPPLEWKFAHGARRSPI